MEEGARGRFKEVGARRMNELGGERILLSLRGLVYPYAGGKKMKGRIVDYLGLVTFPRGDKNFFSIPNKDRLTYVIRPYEHFYHISKFSKFYEMYLCRIPLPFGSCVLHFWPLLSNFIHFVIFEGLCDLHDYPMVPSYPNKLSLRNVSIMQHR